MRCIFTNRTIGMTSFSIGTNRTIDTNGPSELRCIQPGPLNEMHIHQQNHWNDIPFYWYRSYHWYQWTIGLTNRICLCILDMCGGSKTRWRNITKL